MISPGIGEQAAELGASFYRDAELRILQRIARSLEQGIDSPGWEQLQLARLQNVRAEVLAELKATNPVAAAQILQSLTDAYTQGSASALADAGKRLDPTQGMTDQRRRAVAALAADTVRGISSAQPSILRAVDDVYRQVVSDVTASVLTGAEGRRAATQRALSTLLGKGITGIDTKRGRMDLPTYVNMAVRTSTARSAIQGHLDTMDSLGLDLVIIHPGPRACDICDRWARKILARSGQPGTYELESATGGTIRVTVDDTLAAARAAGWGHPNCRCGMAVFVPGVTDPSTIERPPWDGEGYAAQQKQRGIERQIRAAKTQQALAITPDAAAQAKRNVAGWQEEMRNHLELHPDLKRQGKREQIGGTFSGNPSQAAPPPGSKPLKRIDDRLPDPPSLTPKLDRLPRLKIPETPAQATTGLTANPGKGLDPNYSVNCSYVVNAVELRARGFDVIARPLAPKYKGGGRSTDEMARDWQNADGTPASMLLFKGGQRQLNAEAADWPNGARAQVVIQWKGGGAHTFNAEKGDDGKLRYYEGQVEVADANRYFENRKPSSVMGLMRTDNLIPTDQLDEAVMAPDSADAREIREAAAAKAERERLANERIAARRAELATPQGALDEAEKSLERVRNIIDNLLETRSLDDPVVVKYLARLEREEEAVRQARVALNRAERGL